MRPLFALAAALLLSACGAMGDYVSGDEDGKYQHRVTDLCATGNHDGDVDWFRDVIADALSTETVSWCSSAVESDREALVSRYASDDGWVRVRLEIFKMDGDKPQKTLLDRKSDTKIGSGESEDEAARRALEHDRAYYVKALRKEFR